MVCSRQPWREAFRDGLPGARALSRRRYAGGGLMARSGVFDAIEGYYVGHILWFFRVHRIYPCFHDYADPVAVAVERGFDVAVFSAIVEFLHLRTGIFRRDRRKRYRIHEDFRSYYRLEFQIDKFIGAYGPTVRDLQFSLTQEHLGRPLVDRRIEAAAYAEIESPPNPIVLEEVARRGIRSLVDLGCGPGTLLRTLALTDAKFRGWGFDADGEMLEVARTILGQQGLADRITLVLADALRIDEALPQLARENAEAVHCKGLFDEFFRAGEEKAIRFLSKLRDLFPGRLLLNVDYYGKLTRLAHPLGKYQHTLLHDLLQQLTAQGTPPADLGHWVGIYGDAGCKIVHAYEGESSGIDWFVHVVQL
jgi:SAM-dependent methyltransferase